MAAAARTATVNKMLITKSLCTELNQAHFTLFCLEKD